MRAGVEAVVNESDADNAKAVWGRDQYDEAGSSVHRLRRRSRPNSDLTVLLYNQDRNRYEDFMAVDASVLRELSNGGG